MRAEKAEEAEEAEEAEVGGKLSEVGRFIQTKDEWSDEGIIETKPLRASIHHRPDSISSNLINFN